jgi:trans-aconitate methyltransferase
VADRWDSSLYDDRHSFVWKKVGDLIDLLDPQPGNRILDLGCGTGHLTAQIAERGADVIGLDGSASMIAQARQNYPKLKFTLADARTFQFDEPFDAVFSNAALHWIPEARAVIARTAACLKPGGRLVLEMGGKDNIGRIVTALTAAIEEAGYPARNPWYFPSAAEYASLLEERNFEIEALWTIERWNKLEHPEKGLRELLEMFAGHWFEVVPTQERDAVVGDIESRLRPSLWRDGAWWADYRRLRIVARLRS